MNRYINLYAVFFLSVLVNPIVTNISYAMEEEIEDEDQDTSMPPFVPDPALTGPDTGQTLSSRTPEHELHNIKKRKRTTSPKKNEKGENGENENSPPAKKRRLNKPVEKRLAVSRLLNKIERSSIATRKVFLSNMEKVDLLLQEEAEDELEDLSEFPILEAAQKGDLATVVHLITNGGVSVDTRDNANNSLMHIAARYDQVDIITHLIDSVPAQLFTPNKDGALPLHIACQQGSLKIVNLILSTCPQLLEYTNKNNWSLFTYAIVGALERKESADNALWQYLDQKYSDKFKAAVTELLRFAINIKDERSVSAILHSNIFKLFPNILSHWFGLACKAGTLSVVEVFIAKYPDLLTTIYLNIYPMHIAAINGHNHIIDFFLSKKPELLYQERMGSRLAIHDAAKWGRTETVKHLHQKDEAVLLSVKGKNVILDACESGQMDLVDFILEKDPSTLNMLFGRETPLIRAALFGHLSVVKYLLKKGAHHTLSVNGHTLVHAAAQRGHLEILKFIATRNEVMRLRGKLYQVINLSQATTEKVQPAQFTLHRGHLEVFRWYVEEQGFDFQMLIQAPIPTTPQQYAASKGQVDFLNFLALSTPMNVISDVRFSEILKSPAENTLRWLLAYGMPISKMNDTHHAQIRSPFIKSILANDWTAVEDHVATISKVDPEIFDGLGILIALKEDTISKKILEQNSVKLDPYLMGSSLLTAAAAGSAEMVETTYALCVDSRRIGRMSDEHFQRTVNDSILWASQNANLEAVKKLLSVIVGYGHIEQVDLLRALNKVIALLRQFHKTNPSDRTSFLSDAQVATLQQIEKHLLFAYDLQRDLPEYQRFKDDLATFKLVQSIYNRRNLWLELSESLSYELVLRVLSFKVSSL